METKNCFLLWTTTVLNTKPPCCIFVIRTVMNYTTARFRLSEVRQRSRSFERLFTTYNKNQVADTKEPFLVVFFPPQNVFMFCSSALLHFFIESMGNRQKWGSAQEGVGCSAWQNTRYAMMAYVIMYAIIDDVYQFVMTSLDQNLTALWSKWIIKICFPSKSHLSYV